MIALGDVHNPPSRHGSLSLTLSASIKLSTGNFSHHHEASIFTPEIKSRFSSFQYQPLQYTSNLSLTISETNPSPSNSVHPSKKYPQQNHESLDLFQTRLFFRLAFRPSLPPEKLSYQTSHWFCPHSSFPATVVSALHSVVFDPCQIALDCHTHTSKFARPSCFTHSHSHGPLMLEASVRKPPAFSASQKKPSLLHALLRMVPTSLPPDGGKPYPVSGPTPAIQVLQQSKKVRRASGFSWQFFLFAQYHGASDVTAHTSRQSSEVWDCRLTFEKTALARFPLAATVGA